MSFTLVFLIPSISILNNSKINLLTNFCFFTGGDDCKFKWYDLRMDTKQIGSNRIHEAGVTSLHSNSSEEFLLASGR